MQRGVLQLSMAELKALLSVFDVAKYAQMHLSNKLIAGVSAGIDPVSLELSEEELEVIGDEIGVPSTNEDVNLKGARTKIMELTMKFRSAI